MRRWSTTRRRRCGSVSTICQASRGTPIWSLSAPVPVAGSLLSVEAKADESFGALVQDELRRAARKRAQGVTTNVAERIDRLTVALQPRRTPSRPPEACDTNC